MQIPLRQQSTLDAIAEAIEAKARADNYERPYLGMSGVGGPCERENWATFRWITERNAPYWLTDAAECGYLAEDIMAERLRLLPEITLITEGFGSDNQDKSASQIEFADHDGHFRGHADGVILGILEAPKTWHVWEHKDKCTRKSGGKDLIKDLEAAIEKHGEKQALEQWDFVYYVQAQLYMHYSGYKRHYLTVSRGVKRQFLAVRTEYNKSVALQYIDKARRVIDMPVPPARRYGPTYWYCKHFCDHFDWCHGGADMRKNCRTCKHSVPIENGQWGCKLHQWSLTPKEQRDMPCGGNDWDGTREL